MDGYWTGLCYYKRPLVVRGYYGKDGYIWEILRKAIASTVPVGRTVYELYSYLRYYFTA